MPEPERSRTARSAAERALVRIVHHYGSRPEFVLMGGLVPDLLCANSDARHAGTTDVDVQVNLELASSTVNGARLEYALRNAEFEPDKSRVWRWRTEENGSVAVVKFELLADLEDVAAGSTLHFDGCDTLGAVNLRGTRFAARDVVIQTITARIGGDLRRVQINVTGLAGYLLAKTAAARERRLPKDWYDIAFVLLHNDEGGPEGAARMVRERFSGDLVGGMRTALAELAANFSDTNAQGPLAYASQMMVDHPDSERSAHLADAVVAVGTFYRILVSE